MKSLRECLIDRVWNALNVCPGVNKKDPAGSRRFAARADHVNADLQPHARHAPSYGQVLRQLLGLEDPSCRQLLQKTKEGALESLWLLDVR